MSRRVIFGTKHSGGLGFKNNTSAHAGVKFCDILKHLCVDTKLSNIYKYD